MKKLIIVGVVAAFIAGCGGSDGSTSETGATGETGAIATEEQVTASFSEWRYKQASRTSTNEIAVHVDDISCQIVSEGTGKCYETLVVDSLYVGKQVTNNVWDIQFDPETGELGYAKVIK